MDFHHISHTLFSHRSSSRIYQDLAACRSAVRKYSDDTMQRVIMDVNKKASGRKRSPRLATDSLPAMQPSRVMDPEYVFQTCFSSLTQDRPDRKVHQNHQPVFASSVLESQDFVALMSCSTTASMLLFSKAGTGPEDV